MSEWKPLNVTWGLLKQRARETHFDGRTLEHRLAEIDAYREEGNFPARCGLEMGLVGYEELHNEEECDSK